MLEELKQFITKLSDRVTMYDYSADYCIEQIEEKIESLEKKYKEEEGV